MSRGRSVCVDVVEPTRTELAGHAWREMSVLDPRGLQGRCRLDSLHGLLEAVRLALAWFLRQRRGSGGRARHAL